MRIAIVGAGLSGLCFYLFLRNSGLLDAHDVLIYEFRDVTEGDLSSPEAESNYNASLNGGALGLALNGLNVLRRLDQVLYEEIIKTGHPINSWKLSNARGWKLGEIPAKFEGEGGIMIWRRDIWRCFRKRVADSAIVRKKLVKVEVSQVGPQILHFSDETCTPADLIIGADGIWSVVRKAVLEEANASEFLPHYEGLVGCGGVVPLEGMKTIPRGQMNVVFGRNGFFGFGYASDQTAIWWSTYALDVLPDDWRSIDADRIKHQLQTRHKKWKHETVQHIIRDSDIQVFLPTFITPLLPTWNRGGCVLIGDAAHALQPSSGAGASMAFEDAEALALLLEHHLKRDSKNGHIVAFERFTSLRRPRLVQVHKKAQETASMKQDMNVLEEMFMYLIIWAMLFFRINERYQRKLLSHDVRAAVQQTFE